MVFKYLKYLFSLLVLLIAVILSGCGTSSYNIPLLKDNKSAYLYKKMQIAYTWRYSNIRVFAKNEIIYIMLYYDQPRPFDKRKYFGFYIDTQKRKVGLLETYNIPYSKALPQEYYKTKRTYYKSDSKLPVYWLLIKSEKYPKIFFKWDIRAKSFDSGYHIDQGILQVMILPKNASSIAKMKFAQFVNEFNNNNIYLSAQEKAASQYSSYLMGAVSSQLSNALHSDNSQNNTSQNIKIDYKGYDSSTKHYVYDLKYNGEYDGEVFYYSDDKDILTIMSIGIKHGQSINGFYSNDGTLYTTKCGKTSALNINDAIKKTVNCIYKYKY